MRKIYSLLLIVIAYVFIFPLPVKSQDTRIIGGNNINIDEAPWQVLFEINGSDACGGAILTSAWIVTAAHCICETGANLQNSQIIAGITLRSQKNSGQKRNISQIIVHPNYNCVAGNNNLDNDIALLRLDTPLIFNQDIQPIDPATEADINGGLLDPGIFGTITGWGWIDGNGNRPDNLQSAGLPIISNQDALNLGSQVTPNMIPLFQQGIAAAPGDSGGPMVVSDGSNGFILGGISSWGFFPKDQNPTIYTRVSSYCNWLYQHIMSVSGPSLVCTGGAQFTLNDIPPGAQVTWSATPANLFAVSSGTGTTPALSAANSHTIGQGTLTFTISSDCGSQMQVQSDPLWVGVPPIGDITPLYGSGTTVCANQYLQFTHSSSYPLQGLQYTWNVTNGILYQAGGPNAIIRTPPAGQGLEIHLLLSNACGSAHRYRSFVTASVVDGQYCFEDLAMFSIYPNPADDFLTVEASDEHLLDEDEFQLQIFDLFGNSVYHQKLVDQTTIIDRNQLRSGIYQIFIYNKTGEAVEQKRVLIR